MKTDEVVRPTPTAVAAALASRAQREEDQAAALAQLVEAVAAARAAGVGGWRIATTVRDGLPKRRTTPRELQRLARDELETVRQAILAGLQEHYEEFDELCEEIGAETPWIIQKLTSPVPKEIDQDFGLKLTVCDALAVAPKAFLCENTRQIARDVETDSLTPAIRAIIERLYRNNVPTRALAWVEVLLEGLFPSDEL